jgi:hypothetical protein
MGTAPRGEEAENSAEEGGRRMRGVLKGERKDKANPIIQRLGLSSTSVAAVDLHWDVGCDTRGKGAPKQGAGLSKSAESRWTLTLLDQLPMTLPGTGRLIKYVLLQVP